MKKPTTKKTTKRNLKSNELVTVQGGIGEDRTGPGTGTVRIIRF